MPTPQAAIQEPFHKFKMVWASLVAGSGISKKKASLAVHPLKIVVAAIAPITIKNVRGRRSCAATSVKPTKYPSSDTFSSVRLSHS